MQKGFIFDKEISDAFFLLDEEAVIKITENLNNLGLKEKIITKQLFMKNLDKIISLMSDEIIKKSLINLFLGEKIALSVQDGELSKKESKKQADLISQKRVKILSSDFITPKRVNVQDFVKHFINRYEQIKGILQQRNLENLKSIRRIGETRENQNIIVMIRDKRITKNKNIIFEVEDLTGKTKVLINFAKHEIFEKCKNILLDEVVAFNV